MHTRQSNRERSYIGKIYLIEMRHIDKNSSQYKPDRSSIFVVSSKQATAAASDVARTMRLSDLLDGGHRQLGCIGHGAGGPEGCLVRRRRKRQVDHYRPGHRKPTSSPAGRVLCRDESAKVTSLRMPKTRTAALDGNPSKNALVLVKPLGSP